MDLLKQPLFPRLSLASIPLLVLGLGALSTAGCGRQPGAEKNSKRGPQEVLVETALVARERLAPALSSTGTLTPKTEVKITSQAEGQIEQIAVDEGSRVSQGQILVRLNRDELAARHVKALAVLKEAQAARERTGLLFQKGMESRERFDEAATRLEVARAEERLLKTQLDHTEIRSPLDGIVTERKLEPGDVAARHTHVLTVADLSRLVVRTEISELEIPRIAPGQKVEVQVDAIPGRKYAGKVVRVFPRVDPGSRLGIVEVEMAGSPKDLRPGLLCRVVFPSPPSSGALVIPADAVRTDPGGKAFVYRAAGGSVEQVPVTLGQREGLRVEVREGLNPGDRLVIKGFLGLKPGVSIKDATPPPSGPPPPPSSRP